MIPFLKGFLRNLSTVQSKQILRILSQMRDRGEIRDPADFQKRLAELANLVQQDRLVQRTPLVTYQEGDLLESDAMRTFMEQLRLDLDAALGETERLSNSIRAHSRMLTENYFDSIESAIVDLETEVRAYEVLENQKFTGFQSVVKAWSFDGGASVPGADPDDPFSAALFVDSRGGQKLLYSPPGRGEPGIGLAMAEKRKSQWEYFDRIEIITDSTTPQTALSTSMDANGPARAIDGSLDTAWKHSILLTEHPDYVRLKVVPSFTGARRVNLLDISTLSDLSMKLVSLSYVDSGGKEIELPVGTSYAGQAGLYEREGPLGYQFQREDDWILPNTSKLIPLGDIVARKFIVTLQQDTATDGEFFYFNGDLGSWEHSTALEDAAEWMRRQLGDDAFETAVEFGFLGTTKESQRQARFYEYPFGFKEIRANSRDYSTNGLFVSEPFETSAVTTLALYSDVEFPVGELADVEFFLKKENYDSNGLLLDVEMFPMAAYGSSGINERLFLTEIQAASTLKDTGRLRFYPDFSSSFNVHQNGVQLTIGTDYFVSVDGGSTFESSLPPTGTVGDPQRCLVRIFAPQPGALYNVAYTPLVSSSDAGGEVWINDDHTIRLGRYQTYVFNNQRPTGTVAKCKMGVQIIIRANSLNSKVSPYLKGMVLLGG